MIGLTELLSRRFVWPDLSGRRVLVVGLGGGCDIITAYALARVLEPLGPAEMVYANTKRLSDGKLEMLSPHVGRVSGWHPKRIGVHGTTSIDHSLPRGDRGCPFIFLLEEGSASELVDEIRQLGFDLTFAVDAGGDSLTETALSGPQGRDRQMLRVLELTQMPVWHVVVAPGCDGESKLDQLLDALLAAQSSGRYAGALPVSCMLPTFRQFAAGLEPERTPLIILAAAEGRRHPNHSPFHASDRYASAELVTIPRGLQPAIPRLLLEHALFFTAQPVNP
jgi:hypothetical protein